MDAPSQPCLTCGYVTDAVTSVSDEGARPKEGDVSFCLACGALAIFDDDLRFRAATAEEAALLAKDSVIRKLRLAHRIMRESFH
jgi:hypothetical protein